jgi:hypothetical protein
VWPSVFPHGTNQLLLFDGFSWNLKIPSFIKTRQKWWLIYMETKIRIFLIVSRPVLLWMRNIPLKLVVWTKFSFCVQ